MQRIAYGKNERRGSSNTPKPAVLLQHGLLDASHTWVINQPSESLGVSATAIHLQERSNWYLQFILADAGYDVWLGNNRGNTYSNQNVNYTTTDKQFWEFSWDEMALLDLPAQIDVGLIPFVATPSSLDGTNSLFFTRLERNSCSTLDTRKEPPRPSLASLSPKWLPK